MRHAAIKMQALLRRNHQRLYYKMHLHRLHLGNLDTGAIISIGKGCITSISKKQKINTTSSTISELVGVYDFPSQVLWTKSFLLNQGFHVDEATLYQEKKSAMLLK